MASQLLELRENAVSLVEQVLRDNEYPKAAYTRLQDIRPQSGFRFSLQIIRSCKKIIENSANSFHLIAPVKDCIISIAKFDSHVDDYEHYRKINSQQICAIEEICPRFQIVVEQPGIILSCVMENGFNALLDDSGAEGTVLSLDQVRNEFYGTTSQSRPISLTVI